MYREITGVLLTAVMLVGCVQHYQTLRHRAIQLPPGALEQHGIAFITPSTVTGQEQEKQAVALIFASVLQRERPAIRSVTLAETLGTINRVEMTADYRNMYADYRDTGLFKRDTLARVGEVTGVRYVAQLKLQGFSQDERERFKFFGLRILETKQATLRLFFQVWDTQQGNIVWEGTEELRLAGDSFLEQPITLTRILERAAEDLIAKLP